MATNPQRPLQVALVLLTLITGVTLLYRPRPVPLERDFALFPSVLGPWRGEPDILPYTLFRLRGAQEEMARIYRDDNGHAVRLYVGYVESQEQDRELVGAETKERLHRGATEVEVSGTDGTYRVNRLLRRDGPETRIALFWYDLNGRVVASRSLAKLATILDGLLRRRSNGALVVVSPVDGPASGKGSDADLAFVRRVVPALREFLPRGA